MERIRRPITTFKGIKIYMSRETNLMPMYTFDGSPVWADMEEIVRIINYLEKHNQLKPFYCVNPDHDCQNCPIKSYTCSGRDCKINKIEYKEYENETIIK